MNAVTQSPHGDTHRSPEWAETAAGSSATRGDLAQRVLACIRRTFPRQLGKRPIELTHRLYADLNLDSMQLLELQFRLEEELDLRVSDAELGRLRVETVADVIALAERFGGGP